MANDLNQDVLRHLAKLGAQARLQQIETERQAILAAFPDLTGARTARRRGRKTAARQQKAAAPAAAQRRRKPMSAAERKAVSERMTRYWAARRKEKAAKG